MLIHICIFEDNEYEKLYPLTFNKPAYSLLAGIDTLFNKIARFYQTSNISLHCRDYIKPLVKQTFPNYTLNQINIGTPCLFINGRVLMNTELYSTLNQIDTKQNTIYTYQGTVVALYLRGELLNYMKICLNTTPSSKELIKQIRPKAIAKELNKITLINRPWDFIEQITDTIIKDFAYYRKPGIIKGNLKPFVSIYNEDNVFIGNKTNIEDFVVIDATKGPVYITNDVTIKAHSRLEGPLYIGPHTTILGGNFTNSSIGPSCKLKGDISNTIISGYTNKAHDGFLGHSMLGEWVNLGANTTTSNLKNNYSPITTYPSNTPFQTNQQFLGSIIGDHCKTSINTMLNTGTIIGFASQLSGTGFHHKYIPPFAWGSPNHYEPVDFNKLLNTIEKVMKRRNKKLSTATKETLQVLYQLYKTTPQQTQNAPI